MLSVPSAWDELKADCITTVIAPRHPGAVVSDVTVRLRDDGTNRRAWLGLTYAAGAGSETVFAKSVDADRNELIRPHRPSGRRL